MNRVIFYIDGFNLYHAIDDIGDNSLKWVNLWSLCERLIRVDQKVVAVKYFSAYAKWREQAYRRHQRFVAAQEAHGVEVIMGRFKAKRVRCPICRKSYETHEEKETDVNIGLNLIIDAMHDAFYTAFVVSADTDLSVADLRARKEAPGRKIYIIAPPGRYQRNHNPRPLFANSKSNIRSSLLPSLVQTRDGKTIKRPPEYAPK